ncbi:MAG: hypothetical protein ABEJ92_05170 [Halobacteriales archaeon]
MTPWACGIGGCGGSFDDPVALIRHQAVNHPPSECRVCGETVPAGYLAIRHAFDAHTRAEYVRAYDADADAIRIREQLLDVIEERVDVHQLVSQLDGAGEESVVSAGD